MQTFIGLSGQQPFYLLVQNKIYQQKTTNKQTKLVKTGLSETLH